MTARGHRGFARLASVSVPAEDDPFTNTRMNPPAHPQPESSGPATPPEMTAALRIAIGYALLGAGWVFFAEWLHHRARANPWSHIVRASAAGWVFVAVTAMILWLLLQRSFKAARQSARLLGECELRWKQAIEGSSQAVWEWDPETNRASYSDAWNEMLGYVPGEDAGDLSDWESRVHPDDLPGVRAELARHLGGTTPEYVCEYRVRSKDGTYKWVLDRGKISERSPEGKPLRLAGTFSDIDRRKAEEVEHRRREAALRTALDAADTLTWELDAVLNRITYSDNLTDMAGSPDVAPYTDLNAFIAMVHPEDRDRTWNAISETLRTGVPFDAEYRIMLPDGSWHWLAGRGRAVAGADGRFTKVMGASQDITRRKHTEELLMEEAAWRRILIEGSREGIVVIDDTGKVFEANRRFAEMLGYDVAELMDMHVWDWDPLWQRDDVVRAIREMGPDGAQFTTRHRRKDGSMFDVELSNSAADFRGRKLVFCVCHDVTERNRDREALNESLMFMREAERIANMGAWKVNPATDFLYWTEGVYRIIGEPLDYKPGLREGLRYYDEDAVPLLLETLETALKDGKPFSIEIGLTTSAGRHIWTEVRGFARIEEDGQPYVMGTFQDITERKLAEAELVTSRNFLDRVITKSPIPTLIANAEGTVIRTNPAYCALFGITDDNFIGKYNLLQDRQVEEQGLMPLARSAIERGETVTHELTYDMSRMPELRSTLATPLDLVATLFAVRDSRGEVTNLVVQHIDITELKHREGYNRLHLRTFQQLAADEPLEAVLESVTKLLEFGRDDWFGSIMLVTEDGLNLRLGAGPRLPVFYQEGMRLVPLGPQVGSCGAAAATGLPVLVEDVLVHPNWAAFRELTCKAGFRSGWSLPIKTTHGGTLGAIAVYRNAPGLPTAEEVRAIEEVMDLAGVAISKMRSERALREREEIFSSVVEQAADSIAIFELDAGRFVEFNRAAHERLGYSREEFASLSVSDIRVEYPESHIAGIVENLEERGSLSFAAQHRHQDGSLRDAHVSLRRLPVANHRYVAAVWTDITEMKRFEMRETRDRLRTEFLLDLHQRSIQMTRARLLEYVLEQAVRLTGSEIGCIRWGNEADGRIIVAVPNDDRAARAHGEFERHLAETDGASGAILRNNPAAMRDCDPDLLRYMAVPLPLEDKSSIILGVGNKTSDYDEDDLSELRIVSNELHKLMKQRIAQDHLRESEERFRQLVETSYDWIWEMDGEMRYTYASPKSVFLLGYAPHEMLGKTPFDFMPADEAARMRGLYAEFAGAGKPFASVENTSLHKSGREVILESSGSPVLGATGGIIGYRGMDRNVSERKRLEAQLRQSQKMEAVGQLAGGVAHDFNNILAAIMMNLGMLESNEGIDPETRRALEEIDSDARRAADLTRQLLMYSRRSVLTVKRLDLNEVIANLLKMLGRLIGEQNELEFRPHSGLPCVSADAGMLEQIVMNLVVNARDAMPAGGRITITTAIAGFDGEDVAANHERRVGRFVSLGVKDTGCGIEPAALKRVFEPFYTTKEPGKGTGLGLATLHGIVAQHQGWVEVDSTVGEGSEFTIYLPTASGTGESCAQANAAAKPVTGGGEMVVVVEDDTVVRDMLVMAVRHLGYRVRSASDGPECLRLWEALDGKVDLLMTDMVMPGGLTGLALSEQLREKTPSLRVIVSSGYSAEMVQTGAPDSSGFHYLPKPFTLGILAETLRNCLTSPANNT